MRREELAQLAGLGVDYIMRFEQGRSRTPSAQVCSSLARALQLDRVEAELPRQNLVVRTFVDGAPKNAVRAAARFRVALYRATS